MGPLKSQDPLCAFTVLLVYGCLSTIFHTCNYCELINYYYELELD